MYLFMKKFLKKNVSSIFPNIIRYLRQYIATRQASRPQVLENGIIFYGLQNIANYEPHVLSNLIKLSKGHDNFINVGANHGFYIFSLQHNFKKNIAIEALRDNSEIIAKNIFINNLQKRVFLHPLACSEKNEVLNFYGASSGGSLLMGFNEQYDDGSFVQAIKLDQIKNLHLKDESALYLIDVEGSEYSVLKGATKIIEAANSTFVIEICCREYMPNEVFNEDFSHIFKLFFDHGYIANEIMTDASLSKLTLSDIQRMISDNRYSGMMVIFQPNRS